LSIPALAEAFQWVGDLLPEEREGRYFIRGKAIHPCRTYHPREWPEVRVYLEEELKASAPTLKGKPLILDHQTTLPAPNKVLEAAWEDGAVEYVAEVSKPIYDQVKSKEIHHVSIEYNWRILEKLDGIAPRGLELTGLSLLKQLRPGDPSTSAEVWEGIVNKLKEMKGLSQPTLEDRVKWLEEEQRSLWNRIETAFNEVNAKIETLLKIIPVIEGLKEQKDEKTEQERLHQEQLQRSQKYGINPKQGGNLTKPSEYENIPEDQFADPVNWKYPIDADHVDAALKYFNQPDNRSDYSPEEQAKIMEKIVKAALANNIEVSYQPEDPTYKALPEELKAKCKGYEKPKSQEAKDLEEAQKTITALTKERDELSARLNMGEGVVQPGAKPQVLSGYVKAEEVLAILPKQVPYWWGAGPHELVRRLRSKCSQSN